MPMTPISHFCTARFQFGRTLQAQQRTFLPLFEIGLALESRAGQTEWGGDAVHHRNSKTCATVVRPMGHLTP